MFPDFGPQLFDSFFGVSGHNGTYLYSVSATFARGELLTGMKVKVEVKIADIWWS